MNRKPIQAAQEKGSVDDSDAWAGQEICLTLHHAVKDAPRNAQSFHEIAI